MRLLIVSNNLHIGGVQKALVSLLHNIKDKYDVTLLLFNKSGAYLKDVPKEVEVLQVKSPYKYLGMTSKEAASNLKDRISRAFFAAVTRLAGRRYAAWIMSLFQKKITGFDLCISFLHSGPDNLFFGGCNEFVLNHVVSDKKITFLHCDFKAINANYEYNVKQYGRFDRIAACSDGCKKAFLSVCPEFEGKTFTVRNCHMFENIRKAADEYEVSLCQDKLNLLTVARLGKEKGVIRAIDAISELENDVKSKLHYFVVGDGAEKERILEAISKYSLSDTVTMVGEKDNPYPYMKKADLLLIPSLSEAAPLVIDEAASLNTPVLSTETSSAKEMIEKTGYGFVCENSKCGISLAIAELVNNKQLIKNCKNHLENKVFDNKIAIEMFEQVVK